MTTGTKEWLTSSEIAAARLPDLPQTRQGIELMIAQYGWRSTPHARPRAGRGGGFEYHISLLPPAAQLRLRHTTGEATWEQARARKNLLWSRFNALSKAQKAVCEERLKVINRVEQLVRDRGLNRTAAIGVATLDAGIQKSAYYEWRKATEGVDPEDWLAALAPASPSADGAIPQVVECHPDAWDFLKSDYLRPEKPGFSACYRRMMEAARLHGWAPIPSERSLRRRLEADVPKAIQVLTREGKDRAKTLYPAQRRSRAHLHAMQAVNMDGHKLDLFVRLPGRDTPTRMYLVGIQDLYSGKVLAWRLSEAETWEVVRLVVGDMVEQFGIPDRMYIDNGRAFASKKISGGARTRYRFKVRPEDPQGLLTALKIEPHFVLPHSGQSKPVERAWGDFAENISKHPLCSGAYTGKNPSAKPENYAETAIDIEDLKRLVTQQVAEHNARTGRRAETAKGKSFDETFAESMRRPTTIVRQATEAQRFLWLLASEAIKTQKGSGEIQFMGNRYWTRELNQYMGKQITIRFDPDHLTKPIKVYDLNNRFICDAECIADTGFDNQDAARVHARNRAEYRKANAALAKAHRKLSPMELGAILEKGRKAEERPESVRPAVTRIFTGNLAAAPAEAISEEEFSDSFSKALSRVSGGASILSFPKGDTAER
ncbi:transposase domain-containing protein [Sinorhizobium meliloti]|uniref:transposase domain-containing protein n=1 Tax=Rhizobium meliloti TaxID=382 RepID=UPI000FD6DA1A|nr:transposase domain-containing protein [Sinorhizobium meliloti]RVK13464.1 transposase [Sinorhizobium meliloti]